VITKKQQCRTQVWHDKVITFFQRSAAGFERVKSSPNCCSIHHLVWVNWLQCRAAPSRSSRLGDRSRLKWHAEMCFTICYQDWKLCNFLIRRAYSFIEICAHLRRHQLCIIIIIIIIIIVILIIILIIIDYTFCLRYCCSVCQQWRSCLRDNLETSVLKLIVCAFLSSASPYLNYISWLIFVLGMHITVHVGVFGKLAPTLIGGWAFMIFKLNW